MTILTVVVLIIHVIVSLMLILAVLLHAGTGGGLTGVFGSAQSSVFSGSYVVEKNLDRITIVLGVIFAVTTLTLVGILGGK